MKGSYMVPETRMTQNIEEIQRWVAARSGHPALLKSKLDEPHEGLIIAFEDDEESFKISWNRLEELMNEHGLTFIYEDVKDDGTLSKYYQIASRDSFINQKDRDPKDVDYSDNINDQVVK